MLAARLGAPQYQGMHIMSSFICVDGFKVDPVANDMKLTGDTVTAMHIARMTRDVQCSTAVTALNQ